MVAQSELDRLITVVQKARQRGQRVILDVGCGKGISTENLQKRLGDEALVLGIDPDKSKLPVDDGFFALRAEDLSVQLEGQLDGASFSCPYPFSEEGSPHWADIEERRRIFQTMEKAVMPGGMLEVISEDPRIRTLAALTWGVNPGSKRRGLETLNVERTP